MATARWADPQFKALSPAAQRLVLERDDPAFAALSPKAKQLVIQRGAQSQPPSDLMGQAQARGNWFSEANRETSNREAVTDYWRKRDLTKGARHVVEPLGMIAGGVASIPAAIASGPFAPAVVAGGEALGYAGAKKGMDAVEALLGLREQPTLSEIPGDIGTGLAISGGGALVGKGIGATSNAVRRTVFPGAGAEARKLSELARRLEVPLTPATTKQTKPISQVEHALRITPSSAGTMERFDRRTLDALTKTRDDLLRRQGDIPSIGDLGEQVKQSAIRESQVRHGIAQQKFARAKPPSAGPIATPGTTDYAERELARMAEPPATNLSGDVKKELSQFATKPGEPPVVVNRAGFLGKPEVVSPGTPPQRPMFEWERLTNKRAELNALQKAENPAWKLGATGARGMQTPAGRIYGELKTNLSRCAAIRCASQLVGHH